MNEGVRTVWKMDVHIEEFEVEVPGTDAAVVAVGPDFRGRACLWVEFVWTGRPQRHRITPVYTGMPVPPGNTHVGMGLWCAHVLHLYSPTLRRAS